MPRTASSMQEYASRRCKIAPRTTVVADEQHTGARGRSKQIVDATTATDWGNQNRRPNTATATSTENDIQKSKQKRVQGLQQADVSDAWVSKQCERRVHSQDDARLSGKQRLATEKRRGEGRGEGRGRSSKIKTLTRRNRLSKETLFDFLSHPSCGLFRRDEIRHEDEELSVVRVQVYTEVICRGVHLTPTTLRMLISE